MSCKTRLIAALSVLFFLCCGLSTTYLVVHHCLDDSQAIGTLSAFSFLHGKLSNITTTEGTTPASSFLRRNPYQEEPDNLHSDDDALQRILESVPSSSSSTTSYLLTSALRLLSEPDDDGCESYIQFADFDESESLNKNEFIALVNLLADRILAPSFQELPDALRARFNYLASTDGEVWFGTTTTRSDANLQSNVFHHSQERITNVLPASTICSLVREDIALLQLQTTLAYCVQAYAPTFDADQDGKLSSIEYAAFVNQLSRSSSERTFLELPDSVQTIFLAQVAREQTAFDVNDYSLVASFQGICTKVQQIVDAMGTASQSQPSSILVPPEVEDDSPPPKLTSSLEDLKFSAHLDSLFQNGTSNNTLQQLTNSSTPNTTSTNNDTDIPFPTKNSTEELSMNNNSTSNITDMNATDTSNSTNASNFTDTINATDTSSNATDFNTTNSTEPLQTNNTDPFLGNETTPIPTNQTNTTSVTEVPTGNSTQGNSSVVFPTSPAENATSPNTTMFGNNTEPPLGNATSNITDAPLNTSAPIETFPPFNASNTSSPIVTEAPTPDNTTLNVSTPPPATTAPPATIPPTIITQSPTLGTASPTMAPTTQAPTTIPENSTTVKVYDAWVLSNAVGNDAAFLEADTMTLKGIERAYAKFTDDVVRQLAATRDTATRRMLRHRRRLALVKQQGSSTVESIVDSECPDNVPEAYSCVTVLGSVRIIVWDEDAEEIIGEYTTDSRLAIEAGQLQNNLEIEVPGTLWLVEESYNPLDGSPDPPAEPPDVGRGGTDLNYGLVVTSAIAAFLVALVIVLVILPACRKNRELKKAKEEALYAISEAEAQHAAALRKKEEWEKKQKEKDDESKGPPWPKRDHDEGDNPYREEAERLIDLHCPELMHELDSLLYQYQGREEELIAMLLDFADEDIESDSEVEISSLEPESESVSVADSSVDEDVPIAEIEVEEEPSEEIEEAQNIGDDATVEDDDAAESDEETVEMEDRDGGEPEEEEDEEEVMEEIVEEKSESEEEEEEDDESYESSSSDGIFIVPRSAHGLDPPDDDALEPDQFRQPKSLLDPPDDSQSQLEPEEDEDEIFDSQAEPPPDPDSESEQDLEEPPENLSLAQRGGLEPEEEEEPVVDTPPPTPPPEPEKQKPQSKPTPAETEGSEDNTDLITDMITDQDSWLSDETDDGYRIRWFKENGCWFSERVPIGEDFTDSSEYDSDSDSDEGDRKFKWIQEGKGWVKEYVESVDEVVSLLDDHGESSYDSSSSEFESDDDDLGTKWVQKNGRWKVDQQQDQTSLGYSDDSRE